MPEIRMVHPTHGATHAYDTSEVARLRVHGWRPEGEISAPAPMAMPPAASPAEATGSFGGSRAIDPQPTSTLVPAPKNKGGRPRKAQ